MYDIKYAIDVIANDVYVPCLMSTKETLEKIQHNNSMCDVYSSDNDM